MLRRLFGKPAAPPYLAAAEYWVYVDDPRTPKQDDVMERMIQGSPYAKGGSPPIGPREGLLWSDIRFHMALVLREKNAHAFRPDLFGTHIELSPAHLAALAESAAFVKLSYISEQPLSDNRHLQFLVFAAEAVAELSGARVIFDHAAERLHLCSELQADLAENPDAARKDLHLHTIWRTCAAGGTAETRGLRKIGFPELVTPETMNEHRCLARQILDMAADRIWDERVLPPRLVVEHLGDRFHVVTEFAKKGPCRSTILRENA